MLQPTLTRRILACLQGLATGDAIGKQTEGLSRGQVARWYPEGVRGFEGAPGTVIPRYSGNRKRQWRFGETTDDTERALAVARAILDDGYVHHASVGRELLTCTKCVHPGLKSLLEFHQANDAGRMTDQHDGCGAAIRVAPVGILYRSCRLEEIVSAAREASISTHGGALALAGAAAAAVAVSSAIDGADAETMIGVAEQAAARAESARSGSPVSRMALSIRAIYDDFRGRPVPEPAALAAHWFPVDSLTVVPLALTLATVMDSAERAIVWAANVGGDSDSVASIAGSILGARFPETVNNDWYNVVEAVNDHRLVPIAKSLADLRH
jgi:ADP-ribosylglycohydrolase